MNTILSKEKLKKLIEADDMRIKLIVLVMISSGIKISSLNKLKWKHVLPIKDKSGNLLGAKLLVYLNNKEYYTFISPEAYQELFHWINFRKSYGEKITEESYIIRNMWKMIGTNPDHNIQSAVNPKQLKSKSVSTIIRYAFHKHHILLRKASLRSESISDIFRSFFKAICEQAGMRYENIEFLIGNQKKISNTYYKPTEQEIFNDYLKAVDLLTINNYLISKN